MGRADAITKKYMRGNAVFADAFNFLIYDGAPVLKPESLRELDPTELAIPFSGENIDSKEVVQKYRDVLKSAVIKQDEDAAYILLGVENQTDVHYAMPVRNLLYDALQYGRQVSDTAARHSSEKKTGHGRGEYLSGFYKEDKIVPVITLVIHFGVNAWDGPLSLHEMMDVRDERLLKFVQNYQIQLIDPAQIPEESMGKFSSSLREVLSYIKYSRDKQKLSELLTDNPRMRMETDAAQVIREITKTPMKIPEDAEVVDVCKAVEEMLKERRTEGQAEGRTEGILETLAGLVRDGLISIQTAAARANMSQSEFEEAMKKYAV